MLFLKVVHSQYLAAKSCATSEDGNVTIIASKHIKGTLGQTLVKRFNLGKRTSKTDSGRRITLRRVPVKFRVNRSQQRNILKIFPYGIFPVKGSGLDRVGGFERLKCLAPRGLA